jgi:3-phenylpropionate/cinnamic acid dioxygenase small subunit
MAVTIVSASSAFAQESHAEDRARIEDLQARYMFALDFGDHDAYAATFAEDGVLDFGMGKTVGRKAIRDLIASLPRGDKVTKAEDGTRLRPAAGRHNITNIVLEIEGNRATGRAYWFHMNNDNEERKAVLDSFGHYEDEMVKVEGEWLFSHRKIYNEQMAAWAAKGGNPCR